MPETYGELVTRLCQLRDQMRTTAPGRQVLGSIRDQLDVMARASRAAGGGTMGAHRGAGAGQGGAGRGGG